MTRKLLWHNRQNSCLGYIKSTNIYDDDDDG